MNKLPISPQKTAVILAIIIVGLAIFSVLGQSYKIGGGNIEFYLKVAEKFNLDGEHNCIPNWFQSSLMIVSAMLLAIIAFFRREVEDVCYRFWMFLSFFFLYLSLDEAVSIHEQLTVPLRQMFHLHGAFFMAWVIPIGLLAALLFVWSLKYLWQLPSRIRWMLFTAGGIYISGALVMEMIDGAYFEKHIEPLGDFVDMTYVLMTTVEESLESFGLAVFIFTLLSYLQMDSVKLPSDVKEKTKAVVGKPMTLVKQVAIHLQTK